MEGLAGTLLSTSRSAEYLQHCHRSCHSIHNLCSHQPRHLKSTDEGENWSMMDIGLPLNTPVFNLVIDPANTATLYTGYSDRSVRGMVIKKSMDGGNSWSVVDVAAGRSAVSITVDPFTPSTLYVTYAGGPTGGFIRSRDGGETWEAIDGGLPAGNSSGAAWLSILPPRRRSIPAISTKELVVVVFSRVQLREQTGVEPTPVCPTSIFGQW